MIAFIKGNIEEKSAGYIIIEAGGIGYKVFMPEPDISKLESKGEQVKIHTYYWVREDNISLYGFLTKEELRTFEILISTSGIGAKSAISILSNITPTEFALAIINEDTKKLTKLPGIGAKSAARMILELKDKLKKQELENNEKIQIKDIKMQIAIDENIKEATSALQVLGYTRKEIEKVLEKIDANDMSIEDIIRKALSLFGKQ